MINVSGALVRTLLEQIEGSGIPRTDAGDAIARWRGAIFAAARRGDLDDVQMLTKEYARWLALERRAT
jgi:hypothetical protein